MPDIPTLDAYATNDGLLLVWCDHEHRWHTHGRCLGSMAVDCPHGQRQYEGVPCTCRVGSGNGHRVAHCACPRSPLKATGYRLREVGRFTAKIKASRKVNRTSACPGAECVEHRATQAERQWRYLYSVDVLEVDCPKCAAPRGTKCVIGRGHHVHQARYEALLPLIARQRETA